MNDKCLRNKGNLRTMICKYFVRLGIDANFISQDIMLSRSLYCLVAFVLLVFAVNADVQVIDNITWTFSVHNGKAAVGGIDGVELNEWQWNLSASGHRSLAAVPSKTTGSITVPSQLGGYPVTYIGRGAFSGSNVRNVTIPPSVTEIGDSAFEDANELRKVTISSGVTRIGRYAFEGCEKLSSINIPTSVVEIGKGAFSNCIGLGSGWTIIDRCATSIGSDCKDTTMELPHGIRMVVGGDADSDFACIGSIPTSVTCISFNKMSGLYDAYKEQVVMKDGCLLGVGLEVKTLEIPCGCRLINDCAFADCKELISISVESGNQAFVVVDGVLYDKAMKNLICCQRDKATVVIPFGVERIWDSAFCGCVQLKSVTIPSSVTHIGEYAFNGCESLVSVKIPASVYFLQDDVFGGESSGGLKSLYFQGDMPLTADFDGCMFGGCWDWQNGNDYFERYSNITLYVPNDNQSWSGVSCWFGANVVAMGDGVKECTIRLDPCYGECKVLQWTVMSGDEAGVLPEPSREGYEFIGWFTDQDVKVTEDSIVNDSVIWYAHWKRAHQLAEKITKVTARQRYPWNGKVDIEVTIQGDAEQIVQAECIFVATNCETKGEVNISTISQVGADSVAGDVCTRRYLWNAASDVGAVKIDDLALTVDVKEQGGVQLWENGPYWADCNVGATKPEEDGYYFCWGDTVGYRAKDGIASEYDFGGFTRVSLKDVTWVSSSGMRVEHSPFSYDYDGLYVDSLPSLGYVNSNGNLVASRDAAIVIIGAPWRMPTDEEFIALKSNCTMTVTMLNGKAGILFTGKGNYVSKSIFLPAAGRGYDFNVSEYGCSGHYWCATWNSEYVDCSESLSAFCFDLNEDYFELECDHSIYYGQSVRPLRGFADVGRAGVTTHLKLDCLTVVRETDSDGEILYYDASWRENGESVRIIDNGTIIATGIVGSYVWNSPADDSLHTLELEILSGGHVIGKETAQFHKIYAMPILDKPTEDEIKAVLIVAKDANLVAKVTNEAEYVAFREWSGMVKQEKGGETTVGAAGVMAAENAWLSYALGSEVLIKTALTDEDLTIEEFEPKDGEDGKFDFTVSVQDVEVGGAATSETQREALKENLKQVFGLEGGTTLDGMAAENVDIKFEAPVGGKVKFTAGPKDIGVKTFFMKIGVK